MSGTTIIELPVPPPPFTLHDAALSFTSHGGSALVPTGCQVPMWDVNQGRDCSKACLDLGQIFGSAETFHNCLSYPTIVQLLSSNVTSHDERKLARSYGITTDDEEIEDDHNIAGEVMEIMGKCFSGYVGAISDDFVTRSCSDFLENATTGFVPQAGPAGSGVRIKTEECISGLCKYVANKATVNVDIGGVGVYISYWLQVGIALIGWVLLKAWDCSLYGPPFTSSILRHGFSRAKTDAWKRHGRYREHKDRLIEALIEFQKAQCFFMLAIQIAALVVMGTGTLNAGSLEEIYNDYTFFIKLSTGGFLPIAFMLFELRTVHSRSWYVFLLSACTVAVSSVTLYKARNVIPAPKFPGAQYPNCASLSPVAYCLGDMKSLGYYQARSSSGAKPALIYSLIILGGLFIDQAGLLRRSSIQRLWTLVTQTEWRRAKRTVVGRFPDCGGFKHNRFSNSRFFNNRLFKNQLFSSRFFNKQLFKNRYFNWIGLHSWRDWRDVSKVLLHWGITIGFLFYFVVYLQTLGSVNDPVQGIPTNFSEWSFGQIVAITVWAGPLLQYLYLEIHGMKGRRYHLPDSWEVVNTNDRCSDAQRNHERADSG